MEHWNHSFELGEPLLLLNGCNEFGIKCELRVLSPKFFKSVQNNLNTTSYRNESEFLAGKVELTDVCGQPLQQRGGIIVVDGAAPTSVFR